MKKNEMIIKFITLALLCPIITFSQIPNSSGSKAQPLKYPLVLKRGAAMDSISSMRGKLGVNPNWMEIRQLIEAKYPNLSSDSSISILKIAHYYEDLAELEPVLLQFLQKFGSTITLEELNDYAWKIFLKSSDQKLIKVAVDLFGERLKTQEGSQSVANWYDTYAGLLYKMGMKDSALEQQMRAYNMLSGKELMLDLTDGSILIGAKKASFLITALKIEMGIPIWEANTIDSIGISLKKEKLYWKKVKGLMLVHYNAKQVDSLIAFTQVRYFKLNKQWSNYAAGLINYVEYLSSRTLTLKNDYAWQVFLYSNDKRLLYTASSWLLEDLKKGSLQKASAYIDTYANLLYKRGRKKEARLWQKKAVDNAPEKEKVNYAATLKKMENGERTW